MSVRSLCSAGSARWLHRDTRQGALELKTILPGSGKSKHDYVRSQCIRSSFGDGDVSTRSSTTAAFSLRDAPPHSGAGGTGLSQTKLSSDKLQNKSLPWVLNWVLNPCLGFQMTCNLKQRKINFLFMRSTNRSNFPLEESGLECTAMSSVFCTQTPGGNIF